MSSTAGRIADNAFLYCSGAGWKNVVHRSELRAVPQSCDGDRVLSRRSYLNCAGAGRAVVGT